MARHPLACPAALLRRTFAILIQIKANCELKKPCSKLVDLAT
jgi:hypothetical protein